MKKRLRAYTDYTWDDTGENGLIPPTVGEGVTWVHERDKHRYRTTLEPHHFRDGKREAHLKETTWVGSCAIGAIHYYARIEISSPNVRNLTKKSNGHGGYVGMPEKHPMKNSIGCFSVEAKRRLTKVEKDLAGEVLGKIGDWTERFNTEKEAHDAALATFKRRFAPGWVLLGHDKEGDEVVLAET